MERVLHQSWQWVRAWVPPGLTAIALVATMIGLWLVMMNPDRWPLLAGESAAPAQKSVERPTTVAGYQPATSGKLSISAPAASGATLAHATPRSECAAIQKEIDSVSVRVRAAGKSKQGMRLRARLRELKELHGEECVAGAGPAS